MKCFCLTDFMPQKVYWSSNIYIQNDTSGIIGELSSFLLCQPRTIVVYLDAVTLCSWFHWILVTQVYHCSYDWSHLYTVEVAPCAWPHVIIAVDYVLQLCDMFGHSTLEWCYSVCMDTNYLVTSTLYVKGTVIGVNSYWAQGLKPPPTFMIMGLAYMTSPPLLWRDIV